MRLHLGHDRRPSPLWQHRVLGAETSFENELIETRIADRLDLDFKQAHGGLLIPGFEGLLFPSAGILQIKCSPALVESGAGL